MHSFHGASPYLRRVETLKEAIINACPSPPKTLFGSLRHLGPGLIISAAVVGSGELIVTTKLGAETGFQLLWFIILACMIKVVVQIEIGRHAILRGETTLQALNGLPGPRWIVSWLVWIWLVMFIATFFQVAGIVGGISHVFIVGNVGVTWPNWLWAMIINGSMALLLLFGRYRFIERSSTVLVGCFTIFTLLAVVALAWTPYQLQFSDIVYGLSFQMPNDFTVAFATFGVIGMGASELIYYPYWCLEKGYGKYIGEDDGTEEWQEHAKGWLRVMKLDAWTSMVIYTVGTIAFYLLGAAVLQAEAIDVGNVDLIQNLSHMYAATFGQIGFWVFLFGSFVVLFSTAFIATASNGRLCADVLRMFHWVPMESEDLRMRWVMRASVLLPVVYFFIYVMVGAPVSLIFVGALAQALMLPFLAFAALYFIYRKTRTEFMPGGAWRFFLWVTAALMTLLGLYQLVTQLLSVMG